MNRRIRKKRHVGEFNYKGFEVTCKFDPSLPDVDTFLDRFLAFCEAHGLMAGGSMDNKAFGLFVTRVGCGRHIGGGRRRYPDVDATEDDRAIVHDFLSTLPGVQHPAVSELRGAWS